MQTNLNEILTELICILIARYDITFIEAENLLSMCLQDTTVGIQLIRISDIFVKQMNKEDISIYFTDNP